MPWKGSEMVESTTPAPRRSILSFLGRRAEPEQDEQNRYTEQALERHKREGLALAIKARWIALSVVALMLPFLNPNWDVLYYHGLLAVMAFNGWVASRVGRVGVSRLELLVLFMDLLIMTVALTMPNPFGDSDWPTAMAYEFGNFIYFFIILAGGTLAYSWRTIIAIGHWTAALWLIGVGLVWYFGVTYPELTEAATIAFGDDPDLLAFFNPNNVVLDVRVQEVVVFILVAYTLALTVRRFNNLLLSNASLERERANLSRYFSPNVVEELSKNDDPLKQIRTHNVAVLFVDIVGFTNLAADDHPENVIGMLRGFHQRMEAEVFRHNGTLDKYLGDGLMATFGTPVAGEQDAINALGCAKAMVQAMEQWNEERRNAGEAEIKANFGVHYGPVVLGDIGVNRLEFAVVGNTVNVASRLEKLTRELDASIAISDHARLQATREASGDTPTLAGFVNRGKREIRGLDDPIDVWTLH